MKKITLLILTLFISFSGFSQVLNEGFEGGTFPPTVPGNWAVFQNAFGSNAWTTSATSHTGTTAALINSRQNIGIGNTSKDFLATPLVTIPTDGQLRFWARTNIGGDQGTRFQIRTASGALPANQTDEAAYTNLVQEWTEPQLSSTYNVYEEKVVNFPPALWGQQVYIAFVDQYTQPGTVLSGDSWFLDDILLVSRCLDPAAQTATGITQNTANLGWSNPSGATSWEIEIMPAGVTPPTGSGLVVNSNPYTATALTSAPFTPLQPGTSYRFFVRALCTFSPSGWTNAYSFTTATPGSTCLAPIIVPSTLPYVTNSDTALYGNNIAGPQGSGCAGGATNYMTGNDVVYSFTPTVTGPITITLSPTVANTSIFVYSSCANIGVSCLAGVANTTAAPRVIPITVTAGQTYFIVISKRLTPVSAPYTLTIIANTCTNLAATFSVVSDCANGAQFFVRADVTNMGSATSIAATDNQASAPQTITAPGQVQFGPFPNGTNVTITLQNEQDANCFLISPNQTQAFCPATNDLCSGAIPVTCGTTVSQDTTGATTTGAPTGTCGGSFAGSGGLWYSFVGTGDIVTFSLCGSSFDTQIRVVTGACGTFTCVAGDDDTGCPGAPGGDSAVVVNTVLGVNYYIYVYGYGTEQDEFTFSTTCVPPPPPPVNDNCDAATLVPTNPTEVCTQSVQGTLVGATPSAPLAIAPCLGTADDDVWFQFVATATTHIINLSGTTANLNHILYSGTTCGALTRLYCSDPNGSIAPNLIIGNTYTIRVYTSTTIANQTVNFTVCITVPPVNDVCSGAIFVPVNSSSACTQTVAGTISGATLSLPALTAPCVGNPDDDVWFQFIASNSYLNISLLNVVGSTTNLNHAVYSGTCSGLTRLYCSTANTLASVANNLIVGQTYYLRVYSNAGTPQTTNFNVCISTPSTCSNSATVCGSVNYQNTTGVTSLGSIGCLGSTPNPTYFTVQVQTTGPITYSLTQTSIGSATPNLDVDYAAWGPFPNRAAGCTAISGGQAPGIGVPVTTSTGCSFLPASIETLNILNAQAGQFYIILITNYSGQTGNISLIQTNANAPGAGVTVCCPEANFFYSPAAYCKSPGATNPVASIVLNSEAGVFSCLNPGLVFQNNLTGEINLAASTAGTYEVRNTIAPAGNCTEFRSQTYWITITDPALPTTAISYSALPITTFCNSDTAIHNVTLIGTTGGSYSVLTVGLSIDSATGAINPSTSTPGLYAVKYLKLSPPCSPFETQTQVEIIATPIITGTLSTCVGATTQLASSATPATLAPWTSSDVAVATVDSTGLVTGVAAGTATITFTNSNGCSATAVVTINPLPVITGTLNACVGTTTQLSSVDPPAATTPWTSSDVAVATVDASGLVTGVAVGFTVISYTNSNGCIGQVTVIITAPAILGTLSACEGATTQLSTSDTPALINPWVSSDVTVATVDNSGLVTGVAAGTTVITYTNSNGCIATATVTINATPTISGTLTACMGATTQLTGSGTPSLTTPWSSSDVAVATIDASGLVTGVTAGTTVITYTTNNGCTVTATVTITPLILPLFTQIAPICQNDVTPPSLPTSSDNLTPIIGTWTPALINTATAGTSTYIFTPTLGQCASGTSMEITIYPIPQIMLDGACEGAEFVLTVTPVNASYDPLTATYLWTGAGLSSNSIQSPTITMAGTFMVTVTDANGCQVSDSIIVPSVGCVIPRGISPNNDGKNDTFDLTGFDVKKISIFNRYGTEIYTHGEGYTNQWKGQSHNGNELPDGTYYYVIVKGDGITDSGWVYINK